MLIKFAMQTEFIFLVLLYAVLIKSAMQTELICQAVLMKFAMQTEIIFLFLLYAICHANRIHLPVRVN